MSSRRTVDQLSPGDPIDEVFLLTDKQVRVNRQGAPYLQLAMRDRTGTVEARYWNVGEQVARRFEPGDYLHARGKVQTFQGGVQIILTALEPIDAAHVDPVEFLPPAVADVDRLWARLRAILLGLGNPHLRALVECCLIDADFVRDFAAAPAGVRNHHAYRGGLLEHVVTLLEAADRISGLYPEIDRDLLLVGAFLHDVGKIRELRFDHTLAYTDEGQLVGHLVIGVCLLREKVARAVELLGEPFPEELRLRIEHMIVSHHGALEFGSPKLPMTPEAIALHCLDNLDAKVHAFAREIRDDPGRSSAWTAFNPALNRRLFKGNSNSDGDGEANGDAGA
jgi:3'-5' exoribonuclease